MCLCCTSSWVSAVEPQLLHMGWPREKCARCQHGPGYHDNHGPCKRDFLGPKDSPKKVLSSETHFTMQLQRTDLRTTLPNKDPARVGTSLGTTYTKLRNFFIFFSCNQVFPNYSYYPFLASPLYSRTLSLNWDPTKLDPSEISQLSPVVSNPNKIVTPAQLCTLPICSVFPEISTLNFTTEPWGIWCCSSRHIENNLISFFCPLLIILSCLPDYSSSLRTFCDWLCHSIKGAVNKLHQLCLL